MDLSNNMQTSNPSFSELDSTALDRDIVQELGAASAPSEGDAPPPPPPPLSRMSRDSHTSSRHSSIRESTATFMRSMFAKRQADYHDDSPANSGLLPGAAVLGMSAISTTASAGRNRSNTTRLHWDNTNNNETPTDMMATASAGGAVRPPSLWRRLSHAPERRHLERELLLHTTAYKVLLISFSVILLFGAEFQELFLPRQADQTMDVVYTIVFVFLLADVVMRIDAEDHYFSFQACCWIRGVCWCKNGNNNNNRGRRSSGELNNSHNGCCRIGSFLFWCDLCSTLTLLADITWINKDRFREMNYSIHLNDFGFAVRVVLCVWRMGWTSLWLDFHWLGFRLHVRFGVLTKFHSILGRWTAWRI